ncbi:VWA domain-containing protein [Candidatus Poribacteria bacterium]|nr:VWA domain-containing protein [Candidatus Poribacteria bacterium]
MLDWRLLHPWFLALLPVPLAWVVWHLRSSSRRRPSVLFSSLEPFRAARPTARTAALRALPYLRLIALILGVVALARPQYGQVERQRAALGVDIALAIDVSGSMQFDDFRPNRLEAAKQVVQTFVEGRDSDRISLVVFATTAAVLCPPTFDRHAVSVFVSSIRDGMLDHDQTAVGMGLALAVDRLKDSEAKSKIAILLTDGENNAGSIAPMQAAEIAKALGVRVYTIGVGTDTNFISPVLGRSPSIDEESLQQIAELTGAKYYRATSATALEEIYKEIDRLEKTDIEVNEYDDYDERFLWFWTPALLLLGVEFLLKSVWLVRLP